MTERTSLTIKVLRDRYRLTVQEDGRIDEIVKALKERCSNDDGELLRNYRQDEIDFANFRLTTERRNEAIAEAYNRGDIQSIFFDY